MSKRLTWSIAGAAGAAALGLAGCASVPPATGPASGAGAALPPLTLATPPPNPTARAIALRAARVLRPYTDPLHTYTLRRPQTWVAIDARSTPALARTLGDGVRFFEPVTASDPDAGSAGRLWVDVVPLRPGSTPRQVLLQPFVAADYPPALLRRLTVVPARLGGVRGYRLVTLPSGNGHQATLLLVRWQTRYYRVTIFGASIPAEVAPALRSWHFLTPRRAPRRGWSASDAAI